MSGIAWSQVGPTVLAAFLASMVEFVEALTVVLAVGSVRGWRDTLLGTGAALGVLLVLVATFGSALTRIPLGAVQFVVGTLLLLFGMRWLRKAVWRAAGVIPLHDEAANFSKHVRLMNPTAVEAGWDPVAFGAAFQITMLEGSEVVFIVIAIGAGARGLLVPAGLGAFAALLVVVALGLVLKQPLSRIPENSLKFVVGVLLSAFGTFWVGEGMGVAWPGGDWSIPALISGFLTLALVTLPLCRAHGARTISDKT